MLLLPTPDRDHFAAEGLVQLSPAAAAFVGYAGRDRQEHWAVPSLSPTHHHSQSLPGSTEWVAPPGRWDTQDIDR